MAVQCDKQNFDKTPIFWENIGKMVFRVAEYESAIRFGKFKMVVQCDGQNLEKLQIFGKKLL